MDLPYALAHSPDSDTSPLGLNLSNSLLRHSPAVILNLHMDIVRFAANSDQRGLASRVSVDVC